MLKDPIAEWYRFRGIGHLNQLITRRLAVLYRRSIFFAALKPPASIRRK